MILDLYVKQSKFYQRSYKRYIALQIFKLFAEKLDFYQYQLQQFIFNPMNIKSIVFINIVLISLILTFGIRQQIAINNQPLLPPIVNQVDVTSFSTLTNPQFPAIANLMTGYLPISDDSKSWVGFTLFPCQKDPQNFKNQPFLFWIDDFGYSSLISAFFETGRFIMRGKDDQGKYIVQQNANSLDNKFNVVYLDLVGSGFAQTNSADDIPMDTNAAVLQLKNIMISFFGYFTLPKTTNIYLAGRSYGAKYVVQLVNALINTDYSNLVSGVALINGHISPNSVVKEIGQFSYNLGLLDFQQRKQVQQYSLLMNRYVRDNKNAEALAIYVKILTYIKQHSGVYDDDYMRSFDIDTDLLQEFFNIDDVKKGWKFTYQNYKSITSDYFPLVTDSLTTNSINSLNAIINNKKKVLIIQGQTILEYNALSALDWVQNLQIAGWKLTDLSLHKINNVTVGHEKLIGNTKFVFFDKSGRYLKNKQLLSELLSWFS